MAGNKSMIRGAMIASQRALIVGLVACSVTAPGSAQADDQPATATPSAGGTSDIVVTATRQSVGSQRVPIALTAVGAQQLAQQGITNASQLNQVSPSLYVLGTVSDGSPRFTLRGLTFTDTQATGSPAVATYIDDVYQSFQFGVYTSLYDLQRVEILRGPQGTTFGRNTTGGAVAYFNQTPTNKYEGYVSARVAAGDQGQQYVEGALNFPLIDGKLSLRISGNSTWKDDYVRDTTTGRLRGGSNSQSGRIQLRYTPDSATIANLTVFGLQRNGDTPLSHGQVYPGPAAVPNVVSLSPLNLYDKFNNEGATLRVEHTEGQFTLTSISHYRRTLYQTSQDLDGYPDGFLSAGYVPDLLYRDRADAKQYGQELRLASDPSRQISGIIGGYYEHDRVNDQINYGDVLDGPGLNYNEYFPYVVTTNAYAIFANLKIKLTDALSLIGGIRKSFETKNDVGSSYYYFGSTYPFTQDNLQSGPAAGVPATQILPYVLQQKSRPLTWDGTVNYNPTASLLVYARLAKGFRSGGFNPPALVTDPSGLPAPVPLVYQGETVRSYEAGVKLGLFDNRLRINASGFHYDYTNQQVTDYSGGYPTTRNSGQSKVDGGEVEITASPVKRLELRSSVSYTNARYTKYVIPSIGADYSGNALQQSPKWTVNGSANYTVPIDQTFNLNANTTWSYRSHIFFDSANSAELRAPSLVTGNVRLALEPASGKGFGVAAFVNNLTNQRPLASGFTYVPGLQVLKYFDTGRLYGLDVTYKW